MNILIVEPSKFSRLVITMTLERHGLVADCVDSEVDARTYIEQQAYQVICVARTLGLEAFRTFCTYLRANPNNRLTPIIMLTGDEYDAESYGALGVTEVFDIKNIRSLGRHIQKVYGKVALTNANRGKILYVEDSSSAAVKVMRQLKMDNHQVIHVRSGEEAIEQYEHGLYDLVLTDVVLSGKINGIALVRHIRENETLKMIPVSILAMSGYDDTSRTLTLLQAGANDYVAKPIMGEELRARVNNLILNQHLLKKLKVQQKRLEQMAMTDQLTGLYNRHYLEHAARKKIALAKRHGIDLSLIVIDVDHFKQVNDQHGHTVGDLVLAHISDLLSSEVRGEDIVARYGGEEFVVILDHCPLDAALEKAENFRAAIERLQPENLPISASFGVAHYEPEQDSDFGALFDRADKAVYCAKDSGRNCVVAA